MQELIWDIKPDLIIETGVARGGSVIFYASMLDLINKNGKVIGIDIDIRTHNRIAIENHPMYKYICLIEGSSTSPNVLKEVKNYIKTNCCKNILVALDSNHTYDHVLTEMRLYSPFVNKGSYMVVFDTIIEDMPANSFNDRPWDKGNNPKIAVYKFLQENKRFDIDKKINDKLLISVAPDGYLKCID
jgi:cephalosporin hydroxylase